MTEEATFYLGPLGDLRELVVPNTGFDASNVRYGGVHQSLSGGRTIDITGYRAQYEMEFDYLDRDEYRWYEALHNRAIPGPFYLIDPLKHNRLSSQASILKFLNTGVITEATYTRSTDWPDIIMPGRSLKLTDWEGSSTSLTFDSGRPVPILDDEVITVSVYAKATAEYAGTLRAAWYDNTGAFISNTDVPISVPTTWERFWFTHHEAPYNAVGATFSILFGTSTQDVWIAAPQVEAGVTVPRDFDIGGGSPLVSIDQMPVASPRFPLRNATMTLLEV